MGSFVTVERCPHPSLSSSVLGSRSACLVPRADAGVIDPHRPTRSALPTLTDAHTEVFRLALDARDYRLPDDMPRMGRLRRQGSREGARCTQWREQERTRCVPRRTCLRGGVFLSDYVSSRVSCDLNGEDGAPLWRTELRDQTRAHSHLRAKLYALAELAFQPSTEEPFDRGRSAAKKTLERGFSEQLGAYDEYGVVRDEAGSSRDTEEKLAPFGATRRRGIVERPNVDTD
jgi:hypothetical protein